MVYLARQPAEHADAAAGELRPRDHGAVHHRHRQLHRAGRLRRGARVHRLQLADRRRPRQHDRRATTRSSTARPITTPPPRSSPSRSIRTAAGPFPARAAARRRAGRASTSSARWRGIRRRPSGWRRGSTSSSSTRRRSPIRRSSTRWRRPYLANNYNIKAMLRTLFSSPQFLQPGELLPALFVAGRVRGARDQGNRLERASRSTPR